MFEKLKSLVHDLTIILKDWSQKVRQQQLEEQREIQKQQVDFFNRNIQLQLQSELFTTFSQASAPNCLRNLSYTADLLISGYSTNQTGQYEYHFKWEKSASFMKSFNPFLLHNIRERLNTIVQTQRARLESDCRSNYSFYEYTSVNYPLTVKGYAITNCRDDYRNPQDYIILTVTIYS